MNYDANIKRVFDITFSLIVLVISFPLLIVVGLLLSIELRQHPLFIQPRPGIKGRVFNLIKFKTMDDKIDERGILLSDEDRLTNIGFLVRKLSIDELPQLINVLKGEMSLIGPRPLLVEYLDLYNITQFRRHEVKPGITGWAQVNGRNAISWKKRFELDLWYVDNLSLWLDTKIFFLTIKKLIHGEGISSETSVTMEKFKGNQSI